MTRLLWKEWQERRLWLGLWVLAVVGNVVFVHVPRPVTDWHYCAFDEWRLPLLAALLAGLGAYGSELRGRRADFLYTRAHSWGQVLLAKLLLGAAAVATAALLGVVACRLTAPAAYLPFITPQHLLWVGWEIIEYTGLAFLLGTACSLVLPGLPGSLLMLLVVVGAAYLSDAVLGKMVGGRYDHWPSLVSFALSMLLTGLLLARNGMTRPLGTRMRRFLLIFLVPALLSTVFVIIETRHDPHIDRDWGFIESPSGANVIAKFTEDFRSQPDQLAWIHKAEQKVYPINFLNERFTYWIQDSRWASGDYLFLQGRDKRMDRYMPTPQCVLLWWENGGLHHYNFSEQENACINTSRLPLLFPAPDQRSLLIAGTAGILVFDRKTSTMRTIIDVPEADQAYGKLDPSVPDLGAPYDRCWWQDADTIGYMHPVSGKRMLVRVRN